MSFQARSRTLLFALIVFLTSSLPTFAVRADGSAVIAMKGGWPDKTPSLGSRFYLDGDAQGGIGAAYAVFVRRRWRFLGSGDVDTTACATLYKELGEPTEQLTNIVGRVHTDELWRTERSDPAFVAQGWTRTDDSEKTYRIFVPEDPFFRPGASYCMYVYLRRRVTTRTLVDLEVLLDKFGATMQGCGSNAAPAACADDASSKLKTDFDELMAGVPAEKATAAWDLIKKKLVNAAVKLADTERVQNLVGAWKVTGPEPDGTLIAIDDAKNPLGAILAELLTRGSEAGELGRSAAGYITAKNETVEKIGLASTFQTFPVSLLPPPRDGKPASAQLGKLEVAADSVKLPKSELSLKDAWMFGEGKLELDGTYLPLRGSWKAVLEKAMRHPGAGTVQQASLDILRKIEAALKRVDDFRITLDKAGRADESNTGVLLVHIKALLSAEPLAATVGQVKRDTSKLLTYIREHIEAAEDWNAMPEVSKETVELMWLQGGVIDLSSRTGLTQQRWFDTYFTPFVGRVNVWTDTADFSEWSLGVQIYGWANSVNEPMWINKADDFRRLFALELGVIPKTSLGPDNRFGGFAGSNTPPLMFGLAAQLVPYVTLSGGGIWLSERETRITGEVPDHKVQAYLSLSVQANVPGIIRNAVAGAETQVVEGRSSK